jgi:hypothetical protein
VKEQVLHFNTLTCHDVLCCKEHRYVPRGRRIPRSLCLPPLSGMDAICPFAKYFPMIILVANYQHGNELSSQIRVEHFKRRSLKSLIVDLTIMLPFHFLLLSAPKNHNDSNLVIELLVYLLLCHLNILIIIIIIIVFSILEQCFILERENSILHPGLV